MPSKDLDLPTYTDVENTLNYTDAPQDETHKKYKGFSTEINPPDHDIINVDPEYVTTRHTIFTIRPGFSKYNNHTTVIFNNENNEVFSCYKKWYCFSTHIYDCNKTPILTVKGSLNVSGYCFCSKTISSGKSSDCKYGKINSASLGDNGKDIISTAEFTNLSSNEVEKLEIRGNGRNKFYVYCNAGKPNETMICKFILHEGINIDVEVAPRVDYMYMFGICLGIFNVNIIKANN